MYVALICVENFGVIGRSEPSKESGREREVDGWEGRALDIIQLSTNYHKHS
jgi:hypothetical protein